MAKWILPAGAVAAGLFLFRSAWAAVLAYHALIAVAWVGRWLPRSGADAVPLPAALARKPVAALLLAGFPAAVLGALVALAPVFSLPDLKLLLGSVGLSPARVLPFAVYLCAANGVLEELYWRRLRSPLQREVPGADVLYALFHLPVVAVYMPAALVLPALASLWGAGLVWRASIRTFGSVLPAMLSHVACNVAIWIWVLRL